VQKTWRIKISRLSAKTYASVVHQIINLTRRENATTTPGSHNWFKLRIYHVYI